MTPPDNNPEPTSSAAPSSSSTQPQALAPVRPRAQGVTAKKTTSTLQVVLVAIGTVIGGIGLVAVAAFGLIAYTCSRH